MKRKTFNFTSHKSGKHIYLLMVYKRLFRYYSRITEIDGVSKEKSHKSRDELQEDFKACVKDRKNNYFKELTRSFKKPEFVDTLEEIKKEQENIL